MFIPALVVQIHSDSASLQPNVSCELVRFFPNIVDKYKETEYGNKPEVTIKRSICILIFYYQMPKNVSFLS